MTNPSGQELFAGPDCEEVLERAKKFISDEGYTSEEVKLVRRNEQILVVAR